MKPASFGTYCANCLKLGKGVFCEVDNKEYHFQDGTPCYLKHCSKCDTHFVVFYQGR